MFTVESLGCISLVEVCIHVGITQKEGQGMYPATKLLGPEARGRGAVKPRRDVSAAINVQRQVWNIDFAL